MQAIDRELLNIIQSYFPVDLRPYQVVGQVVGINEDEAFARIKQLRQSGIIRRLGGVFDSHRLGYFSTLCAGKVPADKINLLASMIKDIPGITHNYLRNHSYNMWFTLIAPSESEAIGVLDRLKSDSGVNEMYSLPAVRVFKIGVDFNMTGGSGENKERATVALRLGDFHDETKISTQVAHGKAYPLTEKDIALIRELQGDMPLSLTPFHDLAERIHWQAEQVIHQTRKMLKAGIIRRFGAVLRHQKAGFTANAMGVWRVEEDRIPEVGKIMAKCRAVSHCYERPTLPDWPYNLFTMVHGRSQRECEETMKKLSEASGVKTYSLLYSIQELKKSSMVYF